MFEPNTVFFGAKPAVAYECANRGEAELLFAIADAGLRGPVSLPATEAGCHEVLKRLRDRLTQGGKLIEELAENRAGGDKLKEQVAETLRQWFIHGKPK
jgi:hypothetical protein